MRAITKARKLKRVTVYTPGKGFEKGWIIGKHWSKEDWEGPTYKEIVQLDNGDIVEMP